MEKLTIDDVKIQNYGSIINRLIKEKGYTIDEFCKSSNDDGYWISPATMKKYLKNDGNRKFRIQVAAKLGVSLLEIEKSPEEQIREMANHAIDNVELYQNDIEILEKIRDLAIKHDMMFEAGKVERWVGVSHFHKGDTEQGLGYMEIALNMLKNERYCVAEEVFACKLDLAIGNYQTYNHNKARKYFEELGDMLHLEIPYRFLYFYYFNYAILEKNFGDVNKAIEFYKNSEIYTDKEEFKMMWIYINLGSCYRILKQYDKSIAYYDMAMEYTSNKKEKFGVFNNMAMVYNDMGDIVKAKQYISEVFDSLEHVDIKEHLNYYHTYLTIYKNNDLDNSIIKRMEDLILIAEKTDINKSHVLNLIDISIDTIGKTNASCKSIIKIITKIIDNTSDGEGSYKQELFKLLGKCNYLLNINNQ